MNSNHNPTKLSLSWIAWFVPQLGSNHLPVLHPKVVLYASASRASWHKQRNLKYLLIYLYFKKQPEWVVAFILVSKFLRVSLVLYSICPLHPCELHIPLVLEGSLNWKQGSWEA